MPEAQTNTQGTGSTETGSTQTTSAEPSFEEILQFDPFEGNDTHADTTTQTTQTGTGEVEAGTEGAGQQQQTQPTQQATTTQQAPPTQQPPTVDQRSLENLIRQQTETITRAMQPPQQQTQTPTTPANKFNLGVPPQLTAALRSEDPKEFEAGVGALINGVANHVWNTIQSHLTETFMPQVPRLIEQHVQQIQQQEQVAKDFYGTYPHLATPALKPIIQNVGMLVAQEFANAGKPVSWSPEMRDAIAEKLYQNLPMLRPAQQTQQTQSTGRRKQPATFNNGARPAPQGVDEFTQVLFGGRQ